MRNQRVREDASGDSEDDELPVWGHLVLKLNKVFKHNLHICNAKKQVSQQLD